MTVISRWAAALIILSALSWLISPAISFTAMMWICVGYGRFAASGDLLVPGRRYFPK
jgi:hypothetical protein